MEQLVREFQEKYRHYVSPDKPTLDIPDDVRKLRIALVDEEVNTELLPELKYNTNLVEIADGIADSIYVLVGCAIAYGIPIDRVFLEVHRSNMTKTAVKESTPGEKYGTKTPKGPDYIPPDIKGILESPWERTDLEQLVYEAAMAGETFDKWREHKKHLESCCLNCGGTANRLCGQPCY